MKTMKDHTRKETAKDVVNCFVELAYNAKSNENTIIRHSNNAIDNLEMWEITRYPFTFEKKEDYHPFRILLFKFKSWLPRRSKLLLLWTSEEDRASGRIHKIKNPSVNDTYEVISMLTFDPEH